MKSTKLLLSVFVLLWTRKVDCLSIIKEIKQSCSVLTDQGTVDLQPVAATDGQTAAFVAPPPMPGVGQSKTLWNPCVDTKVSSQACDNPGEVFQTSATQAGCATISTASQANFSVRNSTLQLNYISSLASINTHITLTCTNKAPTSPFQEQISCWDINGSCYTFTHPQACPKKVEPAGGSGSLSGGSILLIIVLVLLVVYVVGGVLVMKFVKKAEGRELCPNFNFWKNLPIYARDGLMFVVRCGKAPASGYDNI